MEPRLTTRSCTIVRGLEMMSSLYPSLEPPSPFHTIREQLSFLRLSLEPPSSVHLGVELPSSLSSLDSGAMSDWSFFTWSCVSVARGMPGAHSRHDDLWSNSALPRRMGIEPGSAANIPPDHRLQTWSY